MILNAKHMIFPAIFAVLIIAAFGGIMSTSSSAEGVDPVEYYTYSPTFISTATDAEHVEWDFGDGIILDSRGAGTYHDELLAAHGGNVWAPRHTFADNGSASYTDYTVTQTVYNTFEGGSEDSFSSVIRIMGPPVISFNTTGGSAISSIEVPKLIDSSVNPSAYIAQAGSAPVDPIMDGFTFDGWFSDSELTSAYVWSSVVSTDITLYAAWAEGIPPVVDEPDETEDVLDVELIVSLVILISGIALIVLSRVKGSKGFLVIGIVLAIVGGASAYTEYIGSSLVELLTEDLRGAFDDLF